jgi:hypothetical protein
VPYRKANAFLERTFKSGAFFIGLLMMQATITVGGFQ